MTRVFALSDIHLDYPVNVQWLSKLSLYEYQNDIMILAGDISDATNLLNVCFQILSSRFKKVLFVPGNHDLWVFRYQKDLSSLEKFNMVADIARSHGVSMQTFQLDNVSIVPLLSWYDYSFGLPGQQLKNSWMDYHACVWPDHFDAAAITNHFLAGNEAVIDTALQTASNNPQQTVISFSHFLPRIDIMPHYIPIERQFIYPVLGTHLLEPQIRRLQSKIHVYGHSHVNRQVERDGVLYVNNAFGYPSETHIAKKQLVCILEV